GLLVLAQDEYFRPDTDREKLAKLKAAFEKMGLGGFDAMALKKYPFVERIHHLHTAGNSSGIVDGAALALIGSKKIGEDLGLKPRAKIISAAVVGSEPTIMLTGPTPASKKALAQIGMQAKDIDLWEVNEAFAAVVLKTQKELEIDDDKLNVNGGAIALGHPLGATGTMLLGTLLDELERRDLSTGLVTMCVGGGMGIATIIERV
ncbi:MAG: acetyl-CoA C-acetyltransferase, partial [Saprospiraceae bacterium]